MKNIFRPAALILAASMLMSALSGCAFTPTDTSSLSEASQVASAVVTPTPTPVPTPTPEPLLTLTGEITGASKSVLTVTDDKGDSFTVLLGDDTVHTGESYQNGNIATVSYLAGGTTAQGIAAVLVAVEKGEHASKAEELMASMTLAQKVGQMFFTRYPDGAAAEAAQYQFGGYILFGRDFAGKTQDQVIADISACQQSSSVPMFIGVDEEGGTVVRISANPNLCDEPYWSPRKLYADGGTDMVVFAEKDKCQVFDTLGVNVNFAPVCDISQNPDDFMYDRSLGLPPKEASAVITQMVSVYMENNKGCMLKHFPGYGNNKDTHTGIAVDDRPYEQFQQEDFLPFEAGIAAGAGCVLVSHNIVTCMDSEKPASLSAKWHEILREELGFTGCIITDDLSMGAILDYCDSDSAAVQAVIAGNDLLCCTDYQVQLPAVISAVENGAITEERIDESVMRILTWKSQLGLLG